MKTVLIWIKRNIKLFFKDKGLFFTSLITPMILLVLYITFLENVYWDSFEMSVPPGLEISQKVIGAAVGGVVGKQLFDVILGAFASPNKVGGVQAVCLTLITVGTLIYTVLKHKIKHNKYKSLLNRFGRPDRG